MAVRVEEAAAVLSATPGTLQALVGGLPPQLRSADEGPGTWSPYAVVGHLLHCERTDWMPRLRILRAYGTARPFDPVDRTAHLRQGASRPLTEMLSAFAALRAENLEELRGLGLGAADLGAAGTHPAFGRVTLGELIAAWAVHDMDHVAQVARVVAKQYARAVGPWSAYLSILRDRAR